MARRAGQKYVTCPHCGAQAPAIATFCPACGLGLSSAQAPAWAKPAAAESQATPAPETQLPQPSGATAPVDYVAPQDRQQTQAPSASPQAPYRPDPYQPQNPYSSESYAPPRVRRVSMPVRVGLAVIGLITCMVAGTFLGLWLDSLNAPQAASFAVSVAADTSPAGSGNGVTVKVLDGHGKVATGYTGTIHFASSDKKGSVPADYAFTAADKGVHAFAATLKPALTFKTAGSQSVTATDKAKASIKGSATITVTPGVAKSLSLSHLVNPWPAGTVHSVAVTAVDAFGNVATGYTGTIHFDSSDKKAGFPADYTFKAADSGVRKFPNTQKPGLTLRTAGSCWVRVTDLADASITGSQTVTVK